MSEAADKFTDTATKLAEILNLHPMALRSTDIEILRQALEATDKAAREDERERCAKIAESLDWRDGTIARYCSRIAAAIRKGTE